MMTIDTGSIVVAVVVLLIVKAYLNGRKPRGLPPGPPGRPFVGNLLWCWGNRQLHKTLADFKQTYGSMFSLQLGWKSAVVISDADDILKLFVNRAENFSNRPRTLFYKLTKQDKGIVLAHGPHWKALKKMVMTTLRDFGFGKSSMEVRVQDEAKALVEEMTKTGGKPFQLHQMFAKATSNVMCSMLFSHRYDYEDPELSNTVHCMDVFMELGTQANPFAMLPYLIPFLVFQKQYFTVNKMLNSFYEFVETHIKRHRETYEAGNNRDFVDVYIETERDSNDKKIYNDATVMRIIVELFLAGTETTSTTLKWAILYLLKHPKIQDKCRQHILDVIGPDRTPVLTDCDNLPYVEATICEVQRMGNIAPHAGFHATKGAVEVNGYHLPDQTLVIPDYYSVHMDPSLWDEPKVFKPERFIDEQGKLMKSKYLMPYSVGWRSCLGEKLARMELFIFFTSLLQKYTFTTPDVSKLPDAKDAVYGFTLCPPPFDVVAKQVEIAVDIKIEV